MRILGIFKFTRIIMSVFFRNIRNLMSKSVKMWYTVYVIKCKRSSTFQQGSKKIYNIYLTLLNFSSKSKKIVEHRANQRKSIGITHIPLIININQINYKSLCNNEISRLLNKKNVSN